MNNSISQLIKYWFDEIGCQPSDIETGKVKVFPHGMMEGYQGVIFFKKDEGCIVSAPRFLTAALSKELSAKDCEGIFNSDFLKNFFKNNAERIIGPAWLGQINPDHFHPCHDLESRELNETDIDSFRVFLQACSQTEVEFSGLEWGRWPIIGVFKGQALVSASSYKMLGNILAHIGILTHPDFRGNGYAKKVVSHVTAIALKHNIGIQYQTLKSNLPSIALAKALGFTEFAETIAVRLKGEENSRIFR